MTPQRILILMSNTGGGHRASALALQAAFNVLYPDRFQIDIVDLLVEHTIWPLNKAPEIYAGLATHAPWLWGAAYTTQNTPRLIHSGMALPARLSRPKVMAALDQYKPDLIISVHPLAQDIVLPALAQRADEAAKAAGGVSIAAKHIPYYTVVTDLASVHPLWLNSEVDACFVATDDAVQAARAAGIAADSIYQLGLPVRLAFAEPYPPAAELKRRLELDTALPAALLMGGGDGIGPVEEIAAAIDVALFDARIGRAKGQLVVICGRNAELRTRLEERTWRIPVRILGFVEDMPGWMHACDALVTKAGPGTIAEAFICSLPILLSGFIPGQEEGNVAYVLDHGAGAFEREPERIAAQIARWFTDADAQRKSIARNAFHLARPQATFDIARQIVELFDRA
jgi:1,2-diacylglycerol 3-beta-galactosyltransferase